MLKALELIGFKSFADKTRFDFPPGITVVVGPNGSGKSNIVDAIKWVLGEQSVKSLRGKEMADVIFNGSGSRRAVHSAEATLTFDNSKNMLAVDTPDVHITRRVYRSGEGEYLINRQPCRLRDIRDLFAGTGAATEAYSVIEQGKVDVLLQSSPRDRRAIFEEAAGISRFKAKKIESIRRLERVDQNLLRLSDIVEEVESRLRSIRMQAGKARRYKEYSDRLQELRTQVGLKDWRTLSEQIDTHEDDLLQLRTQVDESNAKTEACEAEAIGLEAQIGDLDETLRGCEARIASNRERIGALESTIDHERARGRDLEDEIARHRRNLAAMSTRAGDLEQQVQDTTKRLGQAETEFESIQLVLEQDEATLRDVTEQVDQLRNQNTTRRNAHVDQMRTAATLGNRIGVLESERDTARKTAAQRTEQIERLGQLQEKLHDELKSLREEQDTLRARAARCEAEFKAAQSQLEIDRRRLADAEKALAQFEGRHTGAVERANVLEELEKRLEGLSAGVKEVLVQARESTDGPYRQVRGLVADLFHVNVESAPLVEVALGVQAQHLVVGKGSNLVEYLGAENPRLQGRVSFLRMDFQPPASPVDRVNLEGQPGVLGRADRYVETTAEFIPLVRRLLGRTWFVESLEHAIALSAGAGKGLSYVTLSSQMLAADGTLTVGPRQSATGLISRRSELRALRGTIGEIENSISEERNRVAQLETAIREQGTAVERLSATLEEVTEELGEQRLKTGTAEQRCDQQEKQLETYRVELRSAESQVERGGQELQEIQLRRTEAEAQVEAIEAELELANAELDELDLQRESLSRDATEQQVRLAKSEQNLDSLRHQREQLDRDQLERTRALDESREQLELCRQRGTQSQRAILGAGSEVAELYLSKERLVAETVTIINSREDFRRCRNELSTEAQDLRQSVRKLEEEIHSQDLAAGELKHQRASLVERLREDYDIEIAELKHHPTDEELEAREEVDHEIADLRRKISNIGSVNLEALAELDDLETRYNSLSAQFEDLSKAKASLEQIIGKINADSRRLFSETLETVTEHFQGLFRKLFGGGQADIVLDDAEDVLECGIEIVARPPGKEPRSISLLSGGEKTLTCVALLLAIFKSRPSPFCVLDEVDAALDEANIERFVHVLQEFLAWTQFIVVTHSKKTMTCANTLYGVTMQESGISKRVSVRFDDVSEDGHIHPAALEREEQENPTTDDDGDDETQAA